MARGNWSAYGTKAQARCWCCGKAVSHKDAVRIEMHPAHKACAEAGGHTYTLTAMPRSPAPLKDRTAEDAEKAKLFPSSDAFMAMVERAAQSNKDNQE